MKDPRALISHGLSRVGSLFQQASNKIHVTSHEMRVQSWFDIDGDKTLRLDYDTLGSDSIVFDLGGYEGQWTSDIFSKYCCNIHIFEPVPSCCSIIRRRFAHNQKIFVYDFGLSSTTNTAMINVAADKSSVFYGPNTEKLSINLVSISDFLRQSKISQVDLAKINVEGSEYDILEDLIASHRIQDFINIQVQFHNFVPDAEDRMRRIQEQLKKTHRLTYQYVFVWENWQLNI